MVHCRFFVDSVPIRVFLNNERLGVPYPQKQAMKVASSIWNADNWATQGGLVKINWSHSPFISTYKRFDIDANEIRLMEKQPDLMRMQVSGGICHLILPSLHDKDYFFDGCIKTTLSMATTMIQQGFPLFHLSVQPPLLVHHILEVA